MFRKPPRMAIISLWLAMYCAAWIAPACAQTKRALLIGINTYESAGKTITKPTGAVSRVGNASGSAVNNRWDFPQWTNLDGSLNDVESMHQILASAKYGFEENNIHIVEEAQATRDAILRAMKKFLLDEPNRGDTVVFFYAGHGSQRFNSLTDKPFHLDETIVPSDASSGAFDIRDKEIARLFNQVIDKGIQLTAVFDSCHSGSIARGIPIGSQGKSRFLAYDTRDAADPPDKGPDGKPTARPEDRPGGAVVLSATQHDQSALEWTGRDGKPHGAFTLALLDALQTLPANSSAQDVYKRIKVLLMGMGVAQQPDLGGPAERTRLSLFNNSGGSQRLTVAVRPEGVNSDGTVELDGGLALGLGSGSEFRKVGISFGKPEIRIRIKQLEGLSKSRAEILSAGDASQIQPGDLFELTAWVAPENSRLQVWVPHSPPSNAALLKITEEMLKLRQIVNVSWIDDPLQSNPDYIMAWDGTQWALTNSKAGAAATGLGQNPTASSVLGHLPRDGKSGFFLALPPSGELLSALNLDGGSENSAVEIAPFPDRAQYLLVGRIAGKNIEYAWMKKNFSADEISEELESNEQGNVCSANSPYPPRTNWVPTGTAEDSLAKKSQTLTEYANRLARLRSWLELPAPPQGASDAFPYRLALKRADAIANTVPQTDVALQEKTVREGETYGLALRAEGKINAATSRRWVYVLAIDCSGEGVLLYPRSGEGNFLPEKAPGATAWPTEIDLSQKSGTFSIGSPFGVDTYILLTTADQIADLSAFNFSGGLQATRGGPTSPLAKLLGNASSNIRGANPAVPTNWSIQYMPIRSVASQNGPASSHGE
jgi:Caspase domain